MRYYGNFFNTLNSINSFRPNVNKFVITINEKEVNTFEKNIVQNIIQNKNVTETINSFFIYINSQINIKNNKNLLKKILIKIINDYKETKDRVKLHFRLNRVFSFIHKSLY